MFILIRNRKPIEVEVEIDFDAQKLPLLRKMINSAPWRLRWDYNGWRKVDGCITQNDWNQTLINKINDISGQINKSTLRCADTVIVSKQVLAILEDYEYLKFDGDRIFLGSRYEVFVNKYLAPHDMIVCRMVSDEKDWFSNNRLMGVIRVDGVSCDIEGIDVISQMSTEMSNHMVSQIDKEILSMLRHQKNRKYLLIAK